jgi:ABC-2 type transport system permease protein
MAASAAARPAIPLHRRLYGFGSVYGKTIRDSRLSVTIASGLLGGLSLAMGAAIGTVFPTPEARLEVNRLVGTMPAEMMNLFGNATLMGERLGTLGGYLTWKYGAIFALGTAIWSILALTGTLAGEAARGSLDLVAATPFGKRRIALEKLAAHLTTLAFALAVVSVMVVVSSAAFGDEALGDRIALGSGIAFGAWIGALALCFGGLAFALAPLLGRGGAAVVAGLAMTLLWLASGLGVGGPLVAASPFHWTSGHIPLVGLVDWPGVVATAALGVAFLGAGIELFARRDLGVTAGLRMPRLPAAALGVDGPLARALGDQLPRALAWGLGIGLWGALLASLVGPFAAELGRDSTLTAIFSSIFPGYDFATAGGWLQLYAEIFFIAVGFAATTFVARWASDETDGRLEAILASPLSRGRWVVAGGLAATISVGIVTLCWIAGVAAGAGGVAAGGDAYAGSLSLGLFGIAVVGIGVAVGGLWRASAAAEVAALFVVATYLLDLLAPVLDLPAWVRDLALTAHYGEPMIGRWDPVGVVASIAIAVGGIALGALGMARRDVAR